MISYEVNVAGRNYRVELQRAEGNPGETISGNPATRNEGAWSVRLDGREFAVNFVRISENVFSLILDGESLEIRFESAGDNQRLLIRGRTYDCLVTNPRSLKNRKRTGSATDGAQEIRSSMPGKVVRILAQAGDAIAAGQGILVIEAMKMQNEVRAPKAGVLTKITARQGVNVNAGEVLAVIE